MADFRGSRGFLVEHIELASNFKSIRLYSVKVIAFLKFTFLCLNYSTTSWAIGLISLVKHLHIISNY